MKRIRYVINQQGEYETIPMHGAKDIYKAFFQTTLSWQIIDSHTNVVMSGQASSTHTVKKAIKAGLKELGVQFLDEVRKQGSIE